MRVAKTEKSKEKSDIEKLVDKKIGKMQKEIRENQKEASEVGLHKGWHHLAYDLKPGSSLKKRELSTMLDSYRIKMSLFRKERAQLGAQEPEFRSLVTRFLSTDQQSRLKQDLAEDLAGFDYLTADIDELQRGLLGAFLDLAAQQK